MFRLIAAIVMIMMPIISVSNGTSEREVPFGSRDVIDAGGCKVGECGGQAPLVNDARLSS